MQDVRVMNQVTDAGHGLVVAVNKWDLVDAGPDATGEFLANLRRRYNFLVDYPVVFISALTGKRAMKCLESAARVYANCRSRVPTARLNRLIGTLGTQAPPRGAGREIKLLYATQHAVAPPTFVVFSNRPDLVTDSYRRFVEKHLRHEFEFTGTPVRVVWRRRRST